MKLPARIHDFTVNNYHIMPVQFHSDSAEDDPEGMRILPDELVDVIGMRLNSEGCAAIIRERLNNQAFWLIDQFTDNFVQQTVD